MAKLSAYGRKEVLKAKRELSLVNHDGTPDTTITERRKVLAIMDDGTIMEKYQVRFAPDRYRPNGELHDWGWHKKGKLRSGLTIQAIKDILTGKGYEVFSETGWQIR